MVKTTAPLKRRALRLTQAAGENVFLLSLSVADLLTIGKASADQTQPLAELLGAHQPRGENHVADIQSGLGAGGALLVTTIVIALCWEERFRSSRGPGVSDGLATSGTIEIPLRTRAGRKPAQILDGFHRLLAMSNRKHERFAVPFCAVVANDPDVLRQYFNRTQSTQSLPTGFADLLLPQRAVAISPRIAAHELPDGVCNAANAYRAIARWFDGPSIAVSLSKSSRWVAGFPTATKFLATEKTHGTEGGCKYSTEF